MSRAFTIVLFLVSAAPSLAQELTEGNAAQWGTFASDNGAASVSDDSSRVKVGAFSLRFDTLSGFDTGVRYPRTGSANLNLTGKNYLVFWEFADNNTPIGFQGNQPVIVLKSAAGSYRYEPQGTLMTNKSWRLYRVPLAGDAQWVRTTTGIPTLANITQIEIHHDTWDYGFSIYFDGLEFVTLNPGQDPPPGPPPPPGVNPDAIGPRVLLYIYDPIMENKGSVRMHQAYGWADPVALTNAIVGDYLASSHGLVRYQVVDTQIVDAWPYLESGFQYTDESFDQAWTTGTLEPGTFDYPRFVSENNLGARVDGGDIDEVWVYAFPGAGMWESAMAGRGAYWINGAPYADAGGERAFVIMGWNFERGVGEAIHSWCHRAENTMVHSYGTWAANQSNSWNKFTLLDKDSPGLGGVGNCHYPVNALGDYDYANTRVVVSNADDWANYPDFTGTTRSFNYQEWSPTGADPQREYLNWWYSHLPHFPGRGHDYFLANWWRYLIDVEQFKAWDGNLYLSNGIPSVTTTAPLNGADVSGVVTVRANASVDGALGRVDLYVDGSYHSSDTLSPYVFAWNSVGLTGEHTLVTKAYELRRGTEAVSAPVTVTVFCPADYNRDGFVDGIDSDLFNNDFEAGNMGADYNGDGFVDGIDYDQFNNDFEAGC